MKGKINKRLIKIGIGCLAASLVFTGFIYNGMKKAAVPEAKETVAYFSSKLERDTIIQDRDIIMKPTPVSLIPQGAIKDKSEIEGKRLIVDVNKDEQVFEDKVTERGDIRVDVNEMWTIGIDVKDISNFIGAQLKSDEYYALIYFNPLNGETRIMNKVKVVSLVDSTAKEIIDNGENVVKTINVAVHSQEEMLEIAKAKQFGEFEITKPPLEWEWEFESENSTVNPDMEDINI